MAMTRADTPELEMVLKKDAKPVLKMTFSVSEDGSTLTKFRRRSVPTRRRESSMTGSDRRRLHRPARPLTFVPRVVLR
jgi:hypothetical protein